MIFLATSFLMKTKMIGKEIIMKNIKLLLAILFLCLSMASNGFALKIVNIGGDFNGTDVGSIDTFKAYTNTLDNSKPRD